MCSRRPNLFVIGAPKCGTTALSSYLATHPNIFMSETAGIKEPQYFCTDLTLSHLHTIREESEYLHLFDGAESSHRYIGEATALYLYSNVAVRAILDMDSNARLIVMLRNPLELAESLHNEYMKYTDEIPDFERAWRLQGQRHSGHNLPKQFSDGDALQYGAIAKIGAQMQRLLQHARRDQIHVIVYDDFSKSPESCYAKLVDWLGLDPDARTQFPRINPRRNYRSIRLEKLLRWIKRVRERLHIPGGIGLNSLIDRVNVVRNGKPIRSEFRAELREYFRSDVALLSKLLDRDLTGWTA